MAYTQKQLDYMGSIDVGSKPYSQKQLDYMGSIDVGTNPKRPQQSLLSDELKAGLLYGASALSSMIGGAINYSMFNTQNKFLGLQAEEIELQAMQEINQAREQFNNNIGQLQYGGAVRGIKQSSGSLQNNIEKSAKNFGEDAKTITNNARNQARSLRGQQKINKYSNRANLLSGIGGSLLNLGTNLYALNNLNKE